MTSRAPDSLPRIPELEGDFELVRELGRGGTAVVYLARDRELGRDVAIKLIRPSYLQDEDAVARLEREARTVGKLQHPNIVLLLGTRRLGEKGLALILQFVPGRTLKERIREKGPLPFSEVERVLRDVGRALAYAHRRRIVHRDIKPENVYLDEAAGLARLADFGIARAWDSDSGLTLPGTAIGTPTYMSPEQVDGDDLDGRSDIYSLGLLGYEMLTGTQPWKGESLYNVIYKQKHEALPPLTETRPDIPPHLLRVVNGALRKDPVERWADAKAVLEALEAGPEEGRTEPSAAPGLPAAPDFFAWQTPGSSELSPSPDQPASESTGPEGASPGPESPDSESPRPDSGSVPPEPLAPQPDSGEPERSRFSSTDTRDGGQGVPPGPDSVEYGRILNSLRHYKLARATGPGSRRPPASRTDPPKSGDAQPGASPPGVADPEGLGAEETDAEEPDRWPVAGIWAAALVFLLGIGIAALMAIGGPGTDDPAGLPSDRELGQPGSFDTWAADPTDPGDPTTAPTPGDPDDAATTDLDPALPELGSEPADSEGVLPPGTTLTLIQGDDQSSAPGSPLPQTVVFQVEAPDGSPISGAAIQLEVISGGGSVQPARPISDAAGFVAFQWALGEETGVQAVEATLEGTDTEPVTLTAEAADLVPAAVEVVAGSGQSAEAGATLPAPIRVRVVDPEGRPVPGVAVSFQVSEGAGSVAAGSVTTDETGEANTDWTLGPGAGEQALQVSVPGADLETTIQAEATLATLAPRPILLAGGTFSCALAGGGDVRCWGSNSQGQLGDGAGTRRTSPGPAVGSFTRLTVGISHACALDDVGTPHCWGDNTSGQLGDGSTTTRTQPTPVSDVPPLVEITAGAAHSCGLARTGRVYCWGDNASGQLGDGSTTRRTTPAPVAGQRTFRQVAAGWRHTCAITAGGEAVCWGDNGDGQLGRSGAGAATTPGAVEGGHRFTALSAGSGHTCGLTDQGDLLCWGANQFGQLGDGSTQRRWQPTSVEAEGGVQDVAVGAQHSCAIADTGGALCWGRNLYGQLGDGSTTDRPLPTPVEGSLRFSQLHALGSHTCGRSPAGDLICWGYNSDGQIGDGTRTNRPSPVQVSPSGS